MGVGVAAELRSAGYAIIRSRRAASACDAALLNFARLRQFRYPPVSNQVIREDRVDHDYRNAFNELYTLAAMSLHRAWSSSPQATGLPFDGNDLSTQQEPFSASQHSTPYQASFASLFNYDHGFLNVHRDRGLLTAVYGYGGTHDGTVRLWCRPRDTGEWVDIGAQAARTDACIILFVGEQLEMASGGVYQAIEHACRLDPSGERIDTRLRAHPGARPTGNRHSVALVLCEHEQVQEAQPD